jgi:hypothetical protein
MTMHSGEMPFGLRGMAMGLVADMPDRGAADADARDKPIACFHQHCHPIYHVWCFKQNSDASCLPCDAAIG